MRFVHFTGICVKHIFTSTCCDRFSFTILIFTVRKTFIHTSTHAFFHASIDDAESMKISFAVEELVLCV